MWRDLTLALRDLWRGRAAEERVDSFCVRRWDGREDVPRLLTRMRSTSGSWTQRRRCFLASAWRSARVLGPVDLPAARSLRSPFGSTCPVRALRTSGLERYFVRAGGGEK